MKAHPAQFPTRITRMSHIKKALVFLTLLAVAAAAFFGYVKMKGKQFDEGATAEIEAFSAAIGAPPAATFTYDRLKGLPAPVAAYFRHVLANGVPLVDRASLRMGGSFLPRPNSNYLGFGAEEYFNARTPAFLWYGKIKVSQVLWMYSIERYIDGASSFDRKFMGAFNETHYEHKEDKSSLVRYLGEAVWFPTALLPSGQVRWEPVDDRTARVFMTSRGITVSAAVTFNLEHEIVEFMSHDMEFEKLEKGETREWHMRCADYKNFGGIIIPTEVRAEWELAGGKTLEYARFAVTAAEYNRPGRLPPLPKKRRAAEHAGG